MITTFALLASLTALAAPATPMAHPSAANLTAGIEASQPSAPARELPVQDDDEEEKPDKRDEIKTALKELKGHIGKRGDEDTQAIAIIDTLLQEYPKSGPKDCKAIVKGLSNCMKQTRKPSKEGITDNKLHIAASAALGQMGPESVKSLISWVGHKNFAKDLIAKRSIILALGNTKDEDAVDPLLDLVKHHAPEVQAATAEALGNFTGLDSKGRKEIFKSILDELTRVKNALDVDQTDPIVRERYDAIAGPMLTTLREVSGEDISDPLKYRKWWNDNKKRDWDKAQKGK